MLKFKVTPEPNSAIGLAKSALERWNNPDPVAIEAGPAALIHVAADMGDALTELVDRVESLTDPVAVLGEMLRLRRTLAPENKSKDWLLGAGAGIIYVLDLLMVRLAKEMPPRWRVTNLDGSEVDWENFAEGFEEVPRSGDRAESDR